MDNGNVEDHQSQGIIQRSRGFNFGMGNLENVFFKLNERFTVLEDRPTSADQPPEMFTGAYGLSVEWATELCLYSFPPASYPFPRTIRPKTSGYWFRWREWENVVCMARDLVVDMLC
jgi:hypothetical protein